MPFNRYYQEELNYLRELGAEFASRNASLAPFLAHESLDPDVERLLEGFAFLTGRLRQKLDDELPELSQSLTQLILPHMLAPVPARTVVEFSPLAAAGRIFEDMKHCPMLPQGVRAASSHAGLR